MPHPTAQQYRANLPQSRVDDGLFGPGSASWKIWSHPAVLPGIARSFILDMVSSPVGAAAMEEHSFYREDPLGRFRRTLHYFFSIVYGDSVEVASANRRLDRLHQHITGVEPMTGQPYSALDPFLRLGTQMSTWHSVFYAYAKLGGRPTHEEERAFFAESVLASEAMGLIPDDVRAAAARHGVDPARLPDHLPETREEYRELWSSAGHLVCVNRQTRSALDAILSPKGGSGDSADRALLAAYPGLARLALALIPREIRRLAGLPSSRAVDALALSVGRGAATSLQATGLGSTVLRAVSPPAHDLFRRAELGA